MKKISPERCWPLRERWKDDAPKLQRRDDGALSPRKVNPVSGCLPLLLQIPVFFSLYKCSTSPSDTARAVLRLDQDLSAHDPTSVFNLFGLLPLCRAGLSDAGRLAADQRHGDGRADEDEPARPRSDPAAHVRPDAVHLHVHAGLVPGRPRHLLGLERLPVAGPQQWHDHAPHEGRDSPVRQSEGELAVPVLFFGRPGA